jgi:hypothetical protein
LNYGVRIVEVKGEEELISLEYSELGLNVVTMLSKIVPEKVNSRNFMRQMVSLCSVSMFEEGGLY